MASNLLPRNSSAVLPMEANAAGKGGSGRGAPGAGGELLSSPEPQALAAALGRLAAQFSRGPFLLKHCLSQIDIRAAV